MLTFADSSVNQGVQECRLLCLCQQRGYFRRRSHSSSMLVCVTHGLKQGFTWPCVKQDELLSLSKCVHTKLRREKQQQDVCLFPIKLCYTMQHYWQRCDGMKLGRFNKGCNSRELRKVVYGIQVDSHRKLICSRKQQTLNMYKSTDWASDNLPLCAMSEHMVTATTGLNLSSILTSTIVWGGLQRQNIYQPRLRALTHQTDSRSSLSVCGWPTPIVFTVCSAQLEQVGALSAAVQPIEHVKLTAEAVCVRELSDWTFRRPN